MARDDDPLDGLLGVMARLRSPGGCPWDREQDFASIAPYTIEEAYEVADAIARGEPGAVREELGDLLLQVVFHARMAEERGWFDFADVARGIRDKLIRRHPHVFADVAIGTAAEQKAHWEELKASERAERAAGGAPSALDDVPLALPALLRAEKLGKRAARLGFDWPDASASREKITEELAEIDAELDGAIERRDAAGRKRVAEELGDLLFAVVNFARHLRVDAEDALRAASAKFERRFRHMEALAAARNLTLADLSAEAWDDLWREAKQADPR